MARFMLLSFATLSVSTTNYAEWHNVVQVLSVQETRHGRDNPAELSIMFNYTLQYVTYCNKIWYSSYSS
jgi:hypothetical protein